ncbi:transposase [Candidatus Roizmanbacteria bacterium]|nr:transposase [Candidatus Roizmanbacteria bacterium]
MFKKRTFKEGYFYHICNKSIANYGIFTNDSNKERFLTCLDYYNSTNYDTSLSVFLRKNVFSPILLREDKNQVVKILAYCIMDDHYHLLIKTLLNNRLSKYINDVENSYTRFFNTKLERKGPLWQSNFRIIHIKTSEQLLHVSRYTHLNPVTKYLVDRPEDWVYSSYKFYLNKQVLNNYLKEISINNPTSYKKFVEDNIDYQRKLKLIKKLILE